VGPLTGRSASVTAMARGLPESTRHVDLERPPASTGPLTLALRPARPLTGRVLHGGKPVAGATVVVDPTLCPAARVTGRDGSFSVPRRSEGPVSVEASKAGRRGAGVGSPDQPAEITLVDTGSLALTLAGPDGAILGGVPVELHWWSNDKREFGTSSAATDASGQVTFEDLYPGEGTLVLDGWRLPKGQRLALERPERLALSLALVATVALTGTVLDDQGQPVPGLWASLASPGGDLDHSRSCRTDSDGRFRFDGLLPGEYSLRIRSSDRGDLTRTVTAPGDLALAFPATPALEGVVVDPGGTPQAGLAVSARHERSFRNAVTDAQGRFRLFLERDVEYTVHVFRGGEHTGEEQRMRSAGADVQLRLVVPAPGFVHGVVVDEAGRPVPDAELFFGDSEGPRASLFAQGLRAYGGRLPPSSPRAVEEA